MPPGQKSVKPSFDRLAILRNHPIFGGLGDELLERLASYAIRQTVARGKAIFTRGDPGTKLFAVISGTVKISAPSAKGKSAVFNLITDGGIFGEIALLDGLPRTADATAITDCELMVIERRDFIPLISGKPDVAFKLIELVCKRLRHTTEQLEDVMFLDLPGRLAKTLLQLAKSAKPAARGGMVSLTQRHLGEIIGMSRESTNKQLRAWQDKDWVRLEHGKIAILAPDALAAIASTLGAD
jgi:CRP/FNR family transcriptional regulator, cyclic AMP receptor protein